MLVVQQSSNFLPSTWTPQLISAILLVVGSQAKRIVKDSICQRFYQAMLWRVRISELKLLLNDKNRVMPKNYNG